MASYLNGQASRPQSNIGCYAFIDDACDPGTKATASAHFALGGYLVLPPKQPAVAEALQTARKEFGFKPDHILHFHKLSHERKIRLAQIIAASPIEAFTAVLCKRAGSPKRPWAPDKLYNWMIKLVLERVSWYCRDLGVLGSVTFAHMKGQSVDKTHEYVKKLGRLEGSIEWDHLHLPVRFDYPQVDERLQMADAISSSAGYAFQGVDGICEPRYLKELAPVLWRRKGNLMSYGLKLHPAGNQLPLCAEDHAWIQEL